MASSSSLLALALLFHVLGLNADDLEPGDVSAGVVSDFVTSSEFGTVRSVCKPVPNTMRLCHGIGYEHMRLPNLLGHDTAREAQQQSGAWMPLLSKRCHRQTRTFLCSLFAPVCLPELAAHVLPCRSLCESVRDACAPVMGAFGFPWPEMFNCSRFPAGAELCVSGDGKEDSRRLDVTEIRKGTVLCDACSLASEGERDIEESFCKSQFAFRLQIGASSLEGADLRLVPQGRSRVLRWEGSKQDQQAAMQQSALWLLDGASCSCQALDGQPAGILLALGNIHDDRLVLSRLVKWTRSEKELKKFFRKLTKQQC